MTVHELRDALAFVPGHLPVFVEVQQGADGDSFADWDYLYTLDAQTSNFPGHGSMLVIRINYDPR